MYYKEDWPKAKERIQAWWEGEIIDRCVVSVHALRKTSKMAKPFPEQQWGAWLGGMEKFDDADEASIRQWWMDPEQNYQRMITWFENNYFGGEAIPVTYVNWGASAGAGFMGNEVEFKKSSVWYPPVIKDWKTYEWNFDKSNNEWWKAIIDIVDVFVDRCDGRYMVGKPEVGDAADNLSLMRGMAELAVDTIDCPKDVKAGIDHMCDLWVDSMDHYYSMTHGSNDGGDVLAWMGLWAPGKLDQIACDFSCMLSPDMFRDFFIPELKRMGDWCTHGVYHLDGPEAMRATLDAVLEVDQIKCIEWTPGAGMAPTLTAEYMPQYKKILAAGKRLYLLAQPDEVEPLLTELGPKGLYLRTDVDTEDEANALLKKVETWSAKGNQVSVGAI